jgi:THO complex subunit 1
MPALNVDRPGASAVNAFGDLLVQLLDEASSAKTETTVEPVLIKSDFEDLTSRVDATLPQQSEGAEDDASAAEALKGRQFAVVEGAARDLFDSLIVSAYK